MAVPLTPPIPNFPSSLPKSANKLNDQILNEKNEEISNKVESSSKNKDSIDQLEKIKKLLDDQFR